MDFSDVSESDRCTGYIHHQHSVVGPKHLIIHVNSNHRIRTQNSRTLLQLLYGRFPRTHQFFFVGVRTPSKKIGKPCNEILDEIHRMIVSHSAGKGNMVRKRKFSPQTPSKKKRTPGEEARGCKTRKKDEITYGSLLVNHCTSS